MFREKSDINNLRISYFMINYIYYTYNLYIIKFKIYVKI